MILRGGVLKLAVGVAIVTLLGAQSRAGDYHRGATMICSDCHVMHVTAEGGEPSSKLLKAADTELCLTCHDGQVGSGNVAPDVMGAAGSGQAAHRSAGAFQSSPGQPTSNGHALLIAGTPPGNTASMTLVCTSCHDPHGNTSYRNLVSNPGGQSGLAVTAVTENALSPTATHYEAGNTSYTGSTGGLSAWCGGCHGDFHGTSGAVNMGGGILGDTNQMSVSPWLRHPTRDVTMAQGYSNQHVDSQYWFSALASRVPVVSVSGVVPGSPAGSDNQIFCGSCHKAHGSPHRYGLIWDNAETVEPEDGAAQMDTCQQCHYK